jgi:predicted dehydrogenase
LPGARRPAGTTPAAGAEPLLGDFVARAAGRIGVAVVGLGYWGPNLVRNVSSSRRTRLVQMCDADPARVEQMGSLYPAAACSVDFEATLADPAVEAVAIATPVATHHRLAKAALLAGKHVLVEKPLARTVAEARELVALAKERSRVLLVDHVFLYSPAVRKLRELIVAGEIGDILFIDSVRINLGLFQHDVNVVWDLAPHDLSIIDYLVGRAPRSVVALGSSHVGNGLANLAYLHLDYGEGLLASVHVNWLSPVKVRHFMVGGSRRSIVYNDLDPSERVKVYDRGVDVARDPEGIRQVQVAYRSGDVLAPRLDTGEPLANVIDHFAECIAGAAEPISGGEHGARVVAALEAAHASLERQGARVAL